MSLFANEPALAAPNDPFVSQDDFTEWFGITDVTTVQAARIQTAIEIASAAIRTKTKQQITPVTETITFEVWTDTFTLPESPVTAIASLSIDGLTLQAYDPVNTSQVGAYTSSPPDASIRLIGWYRGVGSSVWGGLGGAAWQRPGVVTVTYTHGWDPLPRDLAGVCLSIAKRLYDSPTGGGQDVQSETLGSWTVQYAQPTGTGFTPFEDEVLSRYTAWTIGF